ncbi:MAG TPA: APC family permease [Dehalococcoidia bacterium]|nr:APC family permease [Dehalococcoidia bacterium]
MAGSMKAAARAGALRPSLRLWQLTATGVGLVIGAGIYVLVGEAAAEAGAGVWMSFAISAALAGLTALTYAELAGMFPSAGVEYEWTSRAFNVFFGFLAGWMMIVAYIIAAATVALGFAHYLQHFADVDIRLSAPLLLVALTVIVASGVERSIWLSVTLAALQIGGLVIVIVAGAPHIGTRSLTEGATATGVMSGAALVFFAFIGFDDIATLAEETRDAATTVPAALMLTLLISGVLYVLVGLSAVSVVAPEVLGGSDRPLALVIQHDWGSRGSDVIAAIALASTLNAALIVLTAASRLLYAMARAGRLPRQLTIVSTRANAPYVAAIVALVAAMPFVLAGGLGLVASVADFAVYATFVAVNFSVIALRLQRPDVARPFRAPFSIRRVPVTPLLALATVIAMAVFLRPEAWMLGVGALVLGALAYWAFARGAAQST